MLVCESCKFNFMLIALTISPAHAFHNNGNLNLTLSSIVFIIWVPNIWCLCKHETSHKEVTLFTINKIKYANKNKLAFLKLANAIITSRLGSIFCILSLSSSIIICQLFNVQRVQYSNNSIRKCKRCFFYSTTLKI